MSTIEKDRKKQIPRALLLAVTFGGAGLSPKAPGTMGTLATVPLLLLLLWAGPFWHMGVTLLLTLVAIVLSERYQQLTGGHDRQEIVIDEVVGYLITMVWLPLTWQSVVAGFVLFRALDILKPWPISFLDAKVKGGLGVVIDDVAAGLVASLILQQILARTSWLGVQVVAGGFF